MLESVERNVEIATEFEVINKCAEQQAHVDIGTLTEIQRLEEDRIMTLIRLCWVAFF